MNVGGADGVANEVRSRDNNEWIGSMEAHPMKGGVYTQYGCECSAPDCKSTIRLTSAEYELIRSEGRRFVICVNHENPEVDVVTDEREFWTIVEKMPGEPARTAEAADPRRVVRLAEPSFSATDPQE